LAKCLPCAKAADKTGNGRGAAEFPWLIKQGNARMGRDGRGKISVVIGPGGHPLTLADLPPARTTRWVIRRKAEVVAAVEGGLMTLDQVCERYNLSVEEFMTWENALHKFGLAGLRATTAQRYRSISA
jgi:hypothetical protein